MPLPLSARAGGIRPLARLRLVVRPTSMVAGYAQQNVAASALLLRHHARDLLQRSSWRFACRCSVDRVVYRWCVQHNSAVSYPLR